ncbi:MAG: ABC transporter ATP-binding protein [Beijerinckiaceae bacterium]
MTSHASKPPLMQLRSVSKTFALGGGLFSRARKLRAVSEVDLDIRHGEVLAIVGESGCGKSTLAKLLLGLLPPSAGEINLDGSNITSLDRKAIARRVQPVFQDPYSSLNPRQRIVDLVALPLAIHGIGDAAEQRTTALAMMDRVGLPARFADRYPSQLSGGQRQRVAIARALVMRPEIIVCDEPTSALDVSVQSQILNLLMELRSEFQSTYVFISHNLAVVEHIATRVAVMYLGRVVELADSATLFSNPQHPYTRALLDSALTPEPGKGVPDTGLGLSFPDPVNPPPGCAFHPRCASAMAVCSQKHPLLAAQNGRAVACHLHNTPSP